MRRATSIIGLSVFCVTTGLAFLSVPASAQVSTTQKTVRETYRGLAVLHTANGYRAVRAGQKGIQAQGIDLRGLRGPATIIESRAELTGVHEITADGLRKRSASGEILLKYEVHFTIGSSDWTEEITIKYRISNGRLSGDRWNGDMVYDRIREIKPGGNPPSNRRSTRITGESTSWALDGVYRGLNRRREDFSVLSDGKVGGQYELEEGKPLVLRKDAKALLWPEDKAPPDLESVQPDVSETDTGVKVEAIYPFSLDRRPGVAVILGRDGSEREIRWGDRIKPDEAIRLKWPAELVISIRWPEENIGRAWVYINTTRPTHRKKIELHIGEFVATLNTLDLFLPQGTVELFLTVTDPAAFVRHEAVERAIRLSTPVAEIWNRKTRYRVDHDADKIITTVKVDRGEVEIRPKNNRLKPFTLKQGQQVSISATDVSAIKPYTPQPPRGDLGGPFSPTGEPAELKGMTLVAAQRWVKQGDSVQIPVYLRKAKDVANINFTMSYDSSVVATQADPFEGNILPENTLFAANAAESAIVRVGFAGTDPASGDGTVTEVRFRAVGKPGDSTPLILDVSRINNPSGTVLPIDVIHGRITIVDESGKRPGDCNGDGRITFRDALCPLLMSIRKMPENLAMDMDNDGTATSRDSVIILEIALGLRRN